MAQPHNLLRWEWRQSPKRPHTRQGHLIRQVITAASRYAIKRRIALILRAIITSSFCSDREGRYERGSRPHTPSRAGRLTKQRQASSY
jgi:hypothetical protein